jgi:hypothetical protein
MPIEVDKIFARHPLNPRGGGSNPPRPPKTFEMFWIVNDESK